MTVSQIQKKNAAILIPKFDSTKEPFKRLGPATATIQDLGALNIAEAKKNRTKHLGKKIR